MGKKTKAEGEGEEEDQENRSSDIFKTLFGREAREEPGLGLGFGSNSSNGDIETDGKFHRNETNLNLTSLKKKKREKGKKPDFDADKPGTMDDVSEKAKKRKREKESNPNSDVGSNGKEEMKKRKKGKEKEKEPNFDGVPIGKSLERNDEEGIVNLKKEKKKRKRDEIEAEYEARNYGVVAKVEGQEEGNLGRRRVVGEKRKTVDDPAEMMVSKEGFDDEMKLLRTIFVGNLPLKIKKKALLKEFRNFGEIESVRIRSVPILDSKTPRKGAIFKGEINESVDSVHGYIVFKDEKSAQASLSHNMAMVEGNHVRVDMACPPRKKLKGENAPLYDNKRTVFVGNLPFDVKDEELYQLFCGTNQLQSNIEAVRVIRDPNTSVGKGIAYVLFKTRDAANFVVKKKHLKLRDRDLRLYHTKSDNTPSKKRNQSPVSVDNFPTKRLAVASSSGSLSDKSRAKATLSYQGLRASKSGIQKKEGFRPKSVEQGKQNPRTKIGVEGKERKSKRPAVAARKTKALKGGGTQRQLGKKRKLESRTPESSIHRNKKVRKVR